MQTTQITYELKDGVALITLNRPDKMNAFTTTMMNELIEVIAEIDRDDNVRVAVVTGAGRAFCAGADLGAGGSTFDESKHGNAVGISEARDGGGRVSLAIFKCRKPVIAAINGAAVGVGITMTLPMDIRVVSSRAKVGFVFTRRGIVLEACSSWFLPRIVGISKAAELSLSGRVFRASQEAESGLFNYVVEPEQVVAKAMELAAEIAQNTSAVSVALCKALLWHGLAQESPEQAHLIDSKCIAWAGKQADCYEGVAAFLEKREPVFKMSAATQLPDFYPWWTEPKV